MLLEKAFPKVDLFTGNRKQDLGIADLLPGYEEEAIGTSWV